MSRYFRRRQDEPRGDLYASWGAAVHLFETDDRHRVTRQIEVYDRGQRLRYDADHARDRYGRLRDQPGERSEWAPFVIERAEFELEWSTGPWTNAPA